MHTKVEVSSFSRSGDTRVSQNSKVGHPEREGFPGDSFQGEAVSVVGLAEAPKEDKWSHPTDREVLSRADRTTNSTTRLNIVSFKNRRHKNVKG